MSVKKRSLFIYIHLATMIFQSLSGLLGGCLLVYDPSGEYMKMPLTMLKETPFSNYLIPGLILLFLLGVFPFFVSIGLIIKSKCKWANLLNIYEDQHWAWTYSLYISIMLIIWIDIQIMLIGYGASIQIAYAFLGVLLLIVTLTPGVKNNYRT